MAPLTTVHVAVLWKGAENGLMHALPSSIRDFENHALQPRITCVKAGQKLRYFLENEIKERLVPKAPEKLWFDMISKVKDMISTANFRLLNELLNKMNHEQGSGPLASLCLLELSCTRMMIFMCVKPFKSSLHTALLDFLCSNDLAICSFANCYSFFRKVTLNLVRD